MGIAVSNPYRRVHDRMGGVPGFQEWMQKRREVVLGPRFGFEDRIYKIFRITGFSRVGFRASFSETVAKLVPVFLRERCLFTCGRLEHVMNFAAGTAVCRRHFCRRQAVNDRSVVAPVVGLRMNLIDTQGC